MAYKPSGNGVVVPAALIEKNDLADRFAKAAQTGAFPVYFQNGRVQELSPFCLFGRWCHERAQNLVILNGGFPDPLKLEDTWPDPMDSQVFYPGISDGASTFETHLIPGCGDAGTYLPAETFGGTPLCGIGAYGFHIPAAVGGQPSDPYYSGAMGFSCGSGLPSIGIAWKLTIGGSRLIWVTADTSQYSSIKRFYELTVDTGVSQIHEANKQISIYGQFSPSHDVLYVWAKPA